MSATLALDEPASRVHLVSPARAAALEKLGVRTVRDLVTHYPHRYIDLSSIRTVVEARIGESCTICGTIHEVTLKRPKPKLSLVEIAIVDATGVLMVTAFRQPWLADSLKAGMRIAVAGKVEFNYGFKRMTNPYLEEVGEAGAAGMIIPVHPATEKISAAWMRRLVGNALTAVRGLYDPLPLDLRCRYRLMSRGCALEAIHFPSSMREAYEARRRLVYEELLMLELFLMQESRARSQGLAPVEHTVDGPRLARLAASLPFALTDEQQQARDEVLAVLAAPAVANHMLLGDVGTGKTVVAAHALAAAADSGGQALLMAPTEVLARQHGVSLGPLLEAAGVSTAVLTGSTPADERARIVDHRRFGVDQRAKLLAKGAAPDALYLTATPIPRTLALALFGDLTLSYIKHRPHAAAQRTTRVVAKQNRGEAYDAARAALARGEQVYVVCPLIGKDAEERDAKAAGKRTPQEGDAEEFHPHVAIEGEGDFADDNISAAVKEARFLQTSVFADYRVELLHGGMSSKDKQQVMDRFRAGETHVLVATTVIEVGVDVPQATVMIIEDADRFGLSQLHQLRGRVGRGSLDAQVFLVSASRQETALARLAAMERTDDGYELAAFDLSLRREGDILGNRQSGASTLKLVNVVRDGAVIEAAHEDARLIMETDPRLEEPDHVALGREVRLLFKGDHAVAGG